MTKRISEETKQLMYELREAGLSTAEISKRANVAPSTTEGYIRAREAGCASPGELRNRWAVRKGYPSYSAYERARIIRNGFPSIYAYRQHLAAQKGQTLRERVEESLAGRYASLPEYNLALARRKGFPSIYAYNEHCARQRQEKSENQRLSELITTRLGELGKNKNWLAKQARVTKQSISRYAQGKAIPRSEVLARLFSAIDVPYTTIDELVES